jgi:hypothetical protein
MKKVAYERIFTHNIAANGKIRFMSLNFKVEHLLHFKCTSGALTGILENCKAIVDFNNFTIANFPPQILRNNA